MVKNFNVNRFGLLLVAAGVLFTSFVTPAPAGAAAAFAPSVPGWLEPNGLSVIDLVGYVPDSYLANAILYATEGFGLIRYTSGSRSGNTVTIHTRVYPIRTDKHQPGWQWTSFGCLGNTAQRDQWDTLMPAGRVRYYADGVDVTAQVILNEYVPAGPIQPIGNTGSSAFSRYPETLPKTGLKLDSQGWGLMPANRGCQVLLTKLTTNITADFQFTVTPRVRVTVMGQQTGTFHTFVGNVSPGWLSGLEVQMTAIFPGRHERIPLSVPGGADYIFVNAPATSFDPYIGYPTYPEVRDLNRGVPSSGTYRLEGNALSVDHVAAMGLPLGGQWRDSGLSGNAVFLPTVPNPRTLTAPEYFLPPNVGYDPCMTSGTCSRALLDQIHDTPMTLTVTYLKVERIATGLTRVPLRQVGPAWTPGAGSAASAMPEAQPAPARPAAALDHFLYLPMISTDPLPPDDRTGCPCGWFDADGRMLDFTPAP